VNKIISTLLAVFLSLGVFAEGFVGGIPTKIMKSDYSTLHLTYIELDKAISAGNCDSGMGVVLHDSNESSQIAVSMAMTAFASGKTFQCYVTNNCSNVTGAAVTFPVCDYYPRILN
jgi:hypothetical protein